MKKYIIIGIVLLALVAPATSSAQPIDSDFVFQPVSTESNPISSGLAPVPSSGGGCKKPTNITELFAYAACVLQGSVIPFLVGLGLILFLVGVVKYVSSGDNEEKREAGRNLMLFGIVALFVMVSVWGFVKMLHSSFFDTPFEVNSGSPIK